MAKLNVGLCRFVLDLVELLQTKTNELLLLYVDPLSGDACEEEKSYQTVLTGAGSFMMIVTVLFMPHCFAGCGTLIFALLVRISRLLPPSPYNPNRSQGHLQLLLAWMYPWCY
jgi:hypothetical protein